MHETVYWINKCNELLKISIIIHSFLSIYRQGLGKATNHHDRRSKTSQMIMPLAFEMYVLDTDESVSDSDMMYLTHVNEDVVMDQIPLAEITQVKEMEAADSGISKANNENQLMIETHPEGYNSGRTYYLQADSKASCQDKIKKLKQYRAAAYERAHAQSVFRQAQIRVLKVYESVIFQRLMAFLIILVSALNCIRYYSQI
jgi:hypothetical protein